VPSERPTHERSHGDLFAAAAAAVARSDDLDDALAELLGLAGEMLGAKVGAVYILDADRDVLELAVTSGVDPKVTSAAESVESVTDSHDPLAAAIRLRRPMAVDDAGHLPVLRGTKTGYLLPLVVRREGIEVALGAMVLGFAGAAPAAATLAEAEPLADLAAVAVERALALALGSERAEWFDRLAHIDPLTGLANRRTVDRILELEVARAGRQGAALSIALFAIDGFDELQRAGGNAAADEALKRVAQVLAESVRLVDTVARHSADQFMLLAPGPDGMIVTERLVRGIAALPAIDGKAVSVSAGIASFPLDARTPEELLAMAEQSVQVAWEAGGNRVAAPAPPAETPAE
jgi:diguanylate cyclase (GGDEF)-like protein